MERCLQSGMKPELVDATVKTKPQKRSLCDGSQHALINNKPSNNQLDIGRKDYSEQYPVLNEIVILNDIQDDNNGINEYPQVLATNITNPIRQQKTLESSEVNRNGLDTNIDIEKLVELCYKEEVNTLSCADVSNSTSGTILPFKKRRTDHYNEATMKICNQPLISFTFEEEFRLHDLIVRREYMNEKTLAHMQDIEPTMVKTATERMFADINANRKVTFDEDYLDFYFSASQKIVSVILPEVFDEFKHLKRDIVNKCIANSFPSTLPLMWACLDSKKDERLLDQDKFLGYDCTTEIEKAEKLLPDIQTRKGMGMEDYSHFISPWAQSWEEEVFFETSVKTLVQLLRGDLKTSLLFQLLLLTSKPVGSAAANSGLKQVKGELGILLYRYLASIHQKREAAEQVHSLMGMVDKLHRCGHILTNRRIRMLPADQ